MKEITGGLWDYYERPGFVVCITTNGTLKRDGTGVMGRGCASEAKKRIPGIDRTLGEWLKLRGNVVYRAGGICFFPVKHNWWEQADLGLIARSARRLEEHALEEPNVIFVLPRPGCGNGRLDWAQVKPVIEFLPDNVWVISR